MNGTTASSGQSLHLNVFLRESPCPCCGELDIQVPCSDCEAWCPEDEWCKARGVAKLRMRIARVLRGAVNRWLDPRDWSKDAS